MAVLDAIGLATLPTEVVSHARGRAAGRRRRWAIPVVLKAAGRDRMAKTAAAGFAIDLEGPDALRLAWERMEETMGDGLVPALVQPMVGPGVDVSVAVRDHPSVGPVLSLGPGGAASALDTAADLRVLPLSDLDAARLVAGSRLAPLLDDTARERARGGAARAWPRSSRRCPRSASWWSTRSSSATAPSVITQAVATRGARSSATARPPVRRV